MYYSFYSTSERFINMKFKCNQSGNTVEFFQEHEIAEMKKHSGYTEVVEVVEAPKTTKKTVKQDETSIDG